MPFESSDLYGASRSATSLVRRAEVTAAASPGDPAPRAAICAQALIASSNDLPHTSGIQNCAAFGDDTAATGAPPVRRTGESAFDIDTPWSGLSPEPLRSRKRPSQPEAVFCVTRPVSQKWREWKCERSGFA